ncbi:MAG: YfhO family protein [bacterium]|nr:YfhO family protein [bacterium]
MTTNNSQNNIIPAVPISSWFSEAWKASLFFAVTLALFFYPAVLQNRLIYSGDLTGSDLLELNIPRRILAAEAVRDGELPLWEPKLGNGLPLLAEGQAALFYPTTVPLCLAFSHTQASNLNILLTLLTALLGSYALHRAYGLRTVPALLGSLAFGLGGIFIFRLKHLNMIQVMAWLPWSFLALRAYWLTSRHRYLILLILSWALQLLAGHPHVCYICWLASFLYGAALCWEQPRQPHTRYTWYHFLGIMAASITAVVLLCSVQLLPTWELTKIASRSGTVSWSDLRVFPFKFAHFLRLLDPFCFGSPAAGDFNRNVNSEGLFWENAPYLGIIPLLFALAAGPLAKAKRTVCPVVVLAIFFAWSALGPSGGLYWFSWKFLPFFNLFRFPSRMLIPASCCAGILAAWGCQYLDNYLRSRYSQRTASITGIILITLTLADLFNTNRLYQSYLPSAWEQPPAALSLLRHKQRLYAPTYILTWEQIIEHRGWYRNEERICYALNTLAPDLAAIWGVHCPSDRIIFDGGNELWHYYDTQSWQFSNICSSFANKDGAIVSFDIFPGLMPYLRLQSISHVLSFIPLRHPRHIPGIGGAIIYTDKEHPELPPLYIYALRDPLPRVRLVAPDLTAELPEFARFIRDNYPSYREGSLYEPSIGNNPSIGSANILHEGHNYLTIATECGRDSFLIVSNTYHPNWSASIDDAPAVPITRVNYAFQGTPIPAGKHLITLRFHSPAFEMGWKISAATLAVLLLLGAWCAWRKHKPNN